MNTLFLWFLFVSLWSCMKQEHHIYVAANGRIQAEGTKEDPYDSFETARDALRSLDIRGPVHVWISEGTYHFQESLILTDEDSGEEGYPVTWSAIPGHEVVITGGLRLEEFEALNSSELIPKVQVAVRPHLYQLDLTKFDIQDLGNIDPRSGNRMELYYNGRYMDIARYPNEEWLTIDSVPQNGEEEFVRDPERTRYGIPVGRHFGRFKYVSDRPASWETNEDIYMHGYWVWDWSDEFQRVDSIDKMKQEIYPTRPYHRYGYHQHQRFYFLNVPEEIDQAGEWYLDKQTQMLLFYPPGDLEDNEVWLSVSDQPLWVLDHVSHVHIKNLSFQCSRGEAIVVQGGRKNLIRSCDFKNFGKTAVSLDGGEEHEVRDSDFSYLSMGGIEMKGGDRKSLTPGKHCAENNHIHHYAHRVRTYQPAITTGGVGNKIRHNLIHDAPHMAIGFAGNDHKIEFNEIFEVLTETSDAGAIYNGRDWTERGTEIRFNYIHDLGATLSGEGFHGVMGVYLDDCLPGTLIYGNIFQNIDRAIMLGGGKDNKVINNIFLNCDLAIHIDARAMGWAKKYAVEGGGWEMYKKLAAVDYKNPPWSVRYPELVHILDDPATPTGVEIGQNICQGGRWLDMRSGTDFDLIDFSENITAVDTVVMWQTQQEPQGKFYTGKEQDSVISLLRDKGNIFTESSKTLVRIVDDERTIEENDLVGQIHFMPIPFSEIGLYTNHHRQTLP